MNVIHISTYESSGGAAIAAKRLMNAQNKAAHKAALLVLKKQTDSADVCAVNDSRLHKLQAFFCFAWERLIIFMHNGFSRKLLFRVSIANAGTDISRHPLIREADLIHLHWINQGFLSIRGIKKLTKLGKPIVWTMHDMWLCTGICHHAWECNNFRNECGFCPFLLSKKKDLSYKIFQKKKCFFGSNIHIVAVSTWLKSRAKESSLTAGMNISVIPNVIDLELFSPSNKVAVRRKYSFDCQKKIILMGAAKLNDPVKGFDMLCAALHCLKKKQENCMLLLFGTIKNDADSMLADLPFNHLHLGLISDTSVIAELYAAADVVVVPSHYETFGQTIIEAMACGCPVVAFNNSGAKDIIDHKTNGYLAEYKDPEDFANGIYWVLNEADYDTLSRNAIAKAAQNFGEAIVAEKYLNLYESLLKA
ncbi:MAG: glycosyltransferase [Tannerellaceae bacterium]|jgi:glycosyltransferase involved in cell wall biosynthesis|nr:glycosyltransferase [Tannerellaceae bacterium]